MTLQSFAEKVLIVGTNPLAYKVAEAIQAFPHRYFILGFVEDGQSHDITAASNGFPICGPLEHLETIVVKLRPHRIVVALSERRGRLPVRKLLDVRMSRIVVEEGVELYGRLTKKLAIENLSPSYLIFSKDFEKSWWQRALHRAFSLTLAALGLTVFAPVMALIALAIKLDSEGPILFVQERIGLGERPFSLFKFRTMYPALVDDEEDSVWSRDLDSRLTRIGKWLRRYKLDELPQLINILRGEMDFVGPRPEMASNVKTMSEQIPYYSIRHIIRPGITGWAQIKNGYALSRDEVTEKVRYDLYYIKYMSIWFDIKILCQTIKILLFGRGAQ